MESSTNFIVSPPHSFTYGKIYYIKWREDKEIPIIQLENCEKIKTSTSSTGMNTVEFKTTDINVVKNLENILEQLRVTFSDLKELKRYGKKEKNTVYFRVKSKTSDITHINKFSIFEDKSGAHYIQWNLENNA